MVETSANGTSGRDGAPRIPFSVPTPAGEGVWRHVWHVEHGAGELAALPPLPVLAFDAIEGPPPRALVLGVLQAGAGRLRVELLSPLRGLNGPDVAYVSRLLWALREALGPLRINGHSAHPILMAAPPAARP